MIILTDLDRIPDLTPAGDPHHRQLRRPPPGPQARSCAKSSAAGREEGGTSCVVTFEPHPLKVLHPERAPQLIQTLTQKRDILAHLGRGGPGGDPFHRTFARPGRGRLRPPAGRASAGPRRSTSARTSGSAGAAEGGIELLQRLQGELGFVADGLPKLKVGGEEVSSSRIRRLLLAGDMEEAVQLLGRPYVIEGVVEHGDGRGKTLGFPTANLAIENELVPAHGVYAVAVDVGEPLLLPGRGEPRDAAHLRREQGGRGGALPHRRTGSLRHEGPMPLLQVPAARDEVRLRAGADGPDRPGRPGGEGLLPDRPPADGGCTTESGSRNAEVGKRKRTAQTGTFFRIPSSRIPNSNLGPLTAAQLIPPALRLHSFPPGVLHPPEKIDINIIPCAET